ncbi:beta-etherase [alpha proteobacterium Q-1]|nr:beta-etherase [alpha proteobacterium Q-1]
MRLFELTGSDEELSFSPYVWRIRMALAHKGIEPERVFTRFGDKSAFAPSGSSTVPVIEDQGQWVSDSWAIACYLEDSYPERPSLFGGAIGRGQAFFMKNWVDRTILAGLFPMLAADICACLDPEDQDYFRTSREKRLGCRLEDAKANREQALPRFRQSLDPLRATLKDQPFICGDHPAFADYLAFGAFVWAHCCSDFQILADDDLICQWRSAMFDLYGGLARSAKRAV